MNIRKLLPMNCILNLFFNEIRSIRTLNILALIFFILGEF